MGKSKKDRRNRQDSDPEDELVAQTAAISIEEGKTEKGEGGAPQKQKKKDKKKKDRRKEESDEDDDEDGIAALARQTGLTEGKKGKQTKQSAFSAFQMLQDEDGEEEEGSNSESEEEEVKPAKKPTKKEMEKNGENEEAVETPSAPAQKNKKKKGGKKGKQEEEDIDAILAELEKPSEKQDKKKKKGKKEEKEEEKEEKEEEKEGKEEKEGTEEMETSPQPVEGVAAKSDKGGPKLIDFSAMTQEEIAAMFDDEDEEEDKKKKKKKKKGKKGGAAEEEKEEEEEGKEEGEEQEEGTVKTAAQKKKEKKERQRLQKLQQKKKGGQQKKEEGDEEEKELKAEKTEEKEEKGDRKEAGAEVERAVSEESTKAPSEEKEQAEGEEKDEEEEGEGDKKKRKKDRKKKKDDKEKKEEVKKKPGNKQLKLIQEIQQKVKEEEERMKREEEEKERKFEEARKAKEEEERKKAEKREKEKQKKKERIDRAKAEGRYLTPKQKEAQRRAQQLVEALQAQGLNVPVPGQAAEDRPKKRPIYTKKKKPQKQQDADKTAGENSAPSSAPETPLVEENKLIEDLEKKEVEKKEEVKEEPKDAWDISSAEEEEEEEEEDSEPKSEEAKAPASVEISVKDSKEEEQEEEEEEEEEDEEEESSDEEDESSEEESSEESSSEEEDEKLTPAEKNERRLEKTRDRIRKRRQANEAKRSTDNLRAAVVCVLGHVDTGKTKILDKLRRTHVQDGEAGGITQQIGATNVPGDTILEQTKMVKEFAKKELKIPGLLIIDTPGHESFSNLRTRGSGLCDIAVLVVDIMHGLEPQTIESINLLKSRKTPFVIALNKIDRLYGWQTNPHQDVHSTLKKQKPNTKVEFDERAKSVIVQMAEQGLNTALFYENKNPREYVSLIPTSAHSGDGMGNLIALICDLCQTMLAKRLAYSQELEAVAMEVKAISGLGTTVDVILVNGKMREGQTIVMAGTEGPIVTQIRGLLMPQPLRELRVKNAYTRNKEVLAAQGVKVIAKDMEKALAGFPVHVAENQDEIEVYRQEIEDVITDVLDSIKVQEKGVYVQASTLGSLEALLEFLRTSKIPFSGINIGPVHKRDVMKASTMLERESQYAVILAFDVKVERDAQDFADSVGVRIFTADIIYHLFDAFMGYREELKRQKQEEFKHLCVFPAKLKILPNCVFNSRDPIVVGVVVEAGFIKEGTPLCVPAKQFVEIGRISSIEFNHKPVESARKGNEVCIKIDPIPGDAPKLVGRHFEETDQLVSKITRQSIDTVKDYFRDEMSKNDWQLIMELKKTFGIL